MFGQHCLLTSKSDLRSINETTGGGMGGKMLTSSKLAERAGQSGRQSFEAATTDT